MFTCRISFASLKPTRELPASADRVAMTYGVAAGTLRQWVRRGHVRTYSDEQVDLFDVLTRVQDTPGA